MTSEEIDQLEAGREADALVASLIPLPGVCMESVPSEPGRRQPYWRYIEGGFREKFRPTTDPAAAALVLEWLCANSGSTGLPGADWDEENVAGAPELAICKAALLAVAGKLFPRHDDDKDRDDQVTSSLEDTR